MSAEILGEVYRVIGERRAEPREGSYVAELVGDGEDRILEKVGEEALELILASKGESKEDVVHECADLLFHTLVLLEYKGIGLEEVYSELAERRR